MYHIPILTSIRISLFIQVIIKFCEFLLIQFGIGAGGGALRQVGMAWYLYHIHFYSFPVVYPFVHFLFVFIFQQLLFSFFFPMKCTSKYGPFE